MNSRADQTVRWMFKMLLVFFIIVAWNALKIDSLEAIYIWFIYLLFICTRKSKPTKNNKTKKQSNKEKLLDLNFSFSVA